MEYQVILRSALSLFSYTITSQVSLGVGTEPYAYVYYESLVFYDRILFFHRFRLSATHTTLRTSTFRDTPRPGIRK